jgi:plastocyanin
MNKHQPCQPNLKPITSMTPTEVWKPITRGNARTQKSCWLTLLLVLMFFSPAQSGDQPSAGAAVNNRAGAIKIFDQYGQPARSGRRPAGGQTFDVTVGPKENKFTFAPNTLNISVGDTVRWTWATDSHSVTSGTDCTADGQYCSPDNTNCDAGILNNTGFVYEHTFTQAGTYSYFCFLHCFAGMTGVINVGPSQRATPTPRPRPTPHPRPVPPQ